MTAGEEGGVRGEDRQWARLGGWLARCGLVPARALRAEQTRRRQAEADLAHHRALLDRAEHAAGLGHWTLDLGTRRLHGSGEMFRLLGFDAREGCRAQDEAFAALLPADREALADRLAAVAREGGALELEGCTGGPEDERRHLRIRGSAHGDRAGRVVAISGFMTDITEHKRALERLQASETRFRHLYQKTPAMMHSVDREGRIINVSDSWLAQLGYTAEEAIGRRSVDFLAPASRRKADQLIAELVKTGRMYNISYQFVTRSGEVRDILLSALAEYDSAGAHVASHAVLVDVTERGRVQRELKRAKEEAESANRAKSEFLANMSHELRTPLNAIIGFSEIMTEELFGALGAPEYDAYARDIHSSAGLLLDIINDILDLSQIEVGKASFNESRFALAPVAREVMEMIEPRAETGQVTLDQRIDPDLPWLTADERAIKQILINLLSNAVKFTPEGGRVTLAAGCEADGRLRLDVTDTGCGIPESEQERIMAPFAQVQGIMTRNHEGSGLGLSIVKSLVELHGGSVALASREGEGTRLTVHLPALRLSEMEIRQTGS